MILSFEVCIVCSEIDMASVLNERRVIYYPVLPIISFNYISFRALFNLNQLPEESHVLLLDEAVGSGIP